MSPRNRRLAHALSYAVLLLAIAFVAYVIWWL